MQGRFFSNCKLDGGAYSSFRLLKLGSTVVSASPSQYKDLLSFTTTCHLPRALHDNPQLLRHAAKLGAYATSCAEKLCLSAGNDDAFAAVFDQVETDVKKGAHAGLGMGLSFGTAVTEVLDAAILAGRNHFIGFHRESAREH